MKKYFLPLFLSVALIFSACQPLPLSSKETNDFDTLVNQLFLAAATSDSLTLNYTLSDPAAYGIQDLPQGFSCLSPDETGADNAEVENLLERLQHCDKNSLSAQNQILYDTLEDTLRQELSYSEHSAFAMALSPSGGIQAQLPVLLSEFAIEDESDLAQYFALLESLPAYFESLIRWEENKRRTNTLLCQATWQHILSQCKKFIEKHGEQVIHNHFAKQMQTLSFNNENELLTKHENLLQEKVIPAYHNLMARCHELKTQAPSDGSLAAYPGGTDYYEYLFLQNTGSDKSVSYWQSFLTRELMKAENTILHIASSNPSVLRTSEELLKTADTPSTLLHALRKKMQEDFPACEATSCKIRNVDSSLEDYLSPAFYLVPPIDRTDRNTIYINNAAKYRLSSLYNTLAHEGYPGHLYQNCYLRQQNLPPLRHMLNYPGYTEGYATYAEIYSYRYTGGSTDEITVLQQNDIANHCLYALCDIGIHYEHWSLAKLRQFLLSHGISGNSSSAIYENIIDSPGSYLPYTIGYWEIIDTKNYYFSIHEDNTEKDFHTYLLTMGPTSFPILKGYCKE